MSTPPQVLHIIARLGGIGILTPQDIPALESQRGKVLNLMSDRKWHSAHEIVATAGGSEGLRRLRELKKLPGFVINKRRTSYNSRLFEYRLVRI